MKVGPKAWQIFSPQVNHWIPLISPYIKSLISTERGLHTGWGGLGWPAMVTWHHVQTGHLRLHPRNLTNWYQKWPYLRPEMHFPRPIILGLQPLVFRDSMAQNHRQVLEDIDHISLFIDLQTGAEGGFLIDSKFLFFSELQIDRVIGLLPLILYGKWLGNPITLSMCSQVFLFWLVDWNGTLGYSRIFNLRLRCLFVWFFRWGWVKKPTKWT